MGSTRSTRSAATAQSLLLLCAAACLFGMVSLWGAPSQRSTNRGPVVLRYVVIDLGTNFVPVGINNSNVIVGYISNGSGSQPATWDLSAVNAPTPLSTNYPGWTNFTVVGINDAGQVAGEMSPITPGTNYMNITGCYWANTNLGTAPVHLGPTSPAGPNGPTGLFVNAISDGLIVGYTSNLSTNALQFNPAWTDTSAAYWYTDGYALALPTSDIYAAHCYPSGASGSSWCGNNLEFSWPVINGMTYTNYTGMYVYAVNNMNIAAGFQGTNAITATPAGGTSLTTNTLGPGRAYHLNNLTTTTGSPPVTMPTPQIVGVDLTYTNAVLWDYMSYNGTNTTVYVQKNLTSLLQQPSDPTQPPTWWTMTSAVAINDSGIIVGTANYNQIPYAPVPHGVMLLPCQFTLLNGDTNTADVDGMFFDGTRPTTISATSNYATSTLAAAAIGDSTGGDGGTNVLGFVAPLGWGRPIPAAIVNGKCYTFSLMMLAKVTPASSGITYAWGRSYHERDVVILNTTTTTNFYWDVRGVDYETYNPDDTGTNLYYTIIPSTNNNIVVDYDNPAAYMPAFAGNGASLGDYACHKRAFTYYLTNSIGSTNAIATQQVGTYITAKRTALTGVTTNDWTGIENMASTTNIPLQPGRH
jgi:hypothetical protein